MNNRIYFQEKQKFTQWWLWLLLIIIAFFILKPIYTAIVENENWTTAQWASLGIIILVMSLLFSTSLETQIKEEGVYVRFFPFIVKPKFIPWSELSSVFVRKYSPLWEYGGWGWRRNIKGTAYNIKGNQGLQLVFKNKTALLIGTQKPEELKVVLRKMRERNSKE